MANSIIGLCEEIHDNNNSHICAMVKSSLKIGCSNRMSSCYRPICFTNSKANILCFLLQHCCYLRDMGLNPALKLFRKYLYDLSSKHRSEQLL